MKQTSLKILIASAFCIICISFNAYSKSMPESMKKTNDGRQIVQRWYNSSSLYTLDSIPSIYLEFKQSNYWNLLTANYQSKTEIPADLTYNGINYSNVGVRFRGQTSYQMAKNSQKKSFNISIDYENPDQNIESYKSLNLLNCFEDASMMREVLYNTITSNTIPSAKANFVKLYINGVSWGIYANVQQLNKDFYEEWFLSNDGANWRAEKPDTSTANIGGGGGAPGMPPGGGFGAGFCSLNYLSDNPLVYSRYYTLKSSDMEDPWQALATSCEKLNKLGTDNLYDSLKFYVDVDRALWHLANEIIFTDDDSYINKGGMDYYVYYDVETSRLTPIQYDANSTFLTKDVSWSPFLKESDTKYPLVNKLLANPQLKQRYVAHIKSIINNYMSDEYAIALVDKYDALIKNEVSADTKKLYSNTQYTSALNEIKNFIKNRKTFLLKNTMISASAPVISDVNFTSSFGLNKNPKSIEKVNIQAKVICNDGINKVLLYYGSGLMGSFEYTEMFDDGNHNDMQPNDGIFGASIPEFEIGSYVRYYIEARSANSYNSVSFSPEGAEHDVYFYQVEPQAQETKTVVINEISPANKTVIADPQGDYEDWVELFNLSNQDYDLTGHYLTDKIDNPKKWQFPDNTIIKANDYLIIYADEDSKDNPNGIHSNFKLSADGEFVMLVNNDANNNTIIDSISFPASADDISYGRYPNGFGNFIKMKATPNAQNIDIGLSINSDQLSSLFEISPNPIINFANINLQIDNPGYYEISIFNINAEKVFDIYKGYLANGNTILNWNTKDYSGKICPDGIYFLQVSSIFGRYDKKFIKISN